MDAKVYNMQGEVVKTMALDPQLFGVAVKPSVVQRAVQAQEANARQTLAHTKTRSEVRGGGKKPWRQKGTGRARHGSIRSPIWVGGGVAFGPRSNRSYTVRLNKKESRQALCMALSAKAADEKILLLDALSLPAIKTKTVADMLKKLPSAKARSILLIQDQSDKTIAASARNIPHCTTILANSLNVRDILTAQFLLLPVAALKSIATTFGPKKA